MNYKRLTPALCVLVLAACTPTNGTTNNGASSSSKAVIQVSSLGTRKASSVPVMVASSKAAVASAPSQQMHIVDMTVTNWAFSPTVVKVKKGEKAQIRVTGGEGIHGFAIDDLGINVRVEGGQTVMIDIPTEAAGTFGGRCSVPCGPGHRDMKFTVVVE